MWLKLKAGLKCAVLCFLAQFHLSNDTINPRLSGTFQLMDEQDLSAAVVFVGDSIIAQMYVNQVVPYAVNFGISAEAVSGVCARIGRFRYPRTARAVVLQIGTNDVLLEVDPADSERSLRCILERIEVPLILSAIHHRSDGFDGRSAAEMNAAIDELNRRWQAACAERPNCRFLPSPLGTLPELAASGLLRDGVHLSPAGYVLWAESLRQALAAPAGGS